MSLLRGPVRRKGDKYVIDLGEDESAIIRRLTGELRALLSDPDPSAEARALITRLFPVAYPQDEEMEIEYQRLMREELVASKLSAFDIVDEAITGGMTIDEGRLIAVMQSINSIDWCWAPCSTSATMQMALRLRRDSKSHRSTRSTVI